MIIGTISFERPFPNFIAELVLKFKVELKSLLHLGQYEPEFYGESMQRTDCSGYTITHLLAIV